MKRVLIAALLFVTGLVLAWAITTPVLTGGGISGGGDYSAGAGMQLGGVIDGFGLPDGYASISLGGTRRLETGPIAVLEARPPVNAADPVWTMSK